MPRPQNYYLSEFFKLSTKTNRTACQNGKCNGKVLSKHSANLVRHLQKVHPEIYKTYIKGKIAAQLRVEEVKSNTITLKKNKVNKDNLERALIELFTKNGRPLCMVEDHAFRILMQPVSDALDMDFTEQNVIDKIIRFSTVIKDEIICELKGRLLSLKIDSVTRQQRSLLGINVQYIKGRSITIQTLAIKELTQNHTGDSLKLLILEVLSDFRIDVSQILTITMDNGKNIINAGNSFIDGLDNELEEEDGEDENMDISSESSLELIERIFSAFPMISNIQCGTHILELCVNDVLNTEEIKVNLEHLRSVVLQLKIDGYKILSDCVTSWISTYRMLEKLLDLREIVNSLSSDNVLVLMSNDDWNFVTEFLKTFKCIFTATVQLQSETQLCYSDIYVIMMDIILQVKNLPGSGIQTYLLKALNKRKSKLFDNELFNAAVFLDPRVKITLRADQIKAAENFIRQLHTRIASLKDNTYELLQTIKQDIDDEPSTSSLTNNTPKTLDEFLDILDSTSIKQEPSIISQLETDMLLYERLPRISLKENVMQFWSCQKNALTSIAQTILAIPCTQVSVERLMSALEYMLSDDSNKLTTMTLEHILFVRVNGEFNYE